MTREPADQQIGPYGARGLAFTGLSIFGTLHWMQMVEPPARQRAWYAVGAGVAVLAILAIASRLQAAAARRVACGAAVTIGLALGLLGGGVADEMLRPDRWGDLLAGLGRGLDSLPGARVPYRGLDEWLRAVLQLGGTLLIVVAALLAFWPRRRGVGLPGPALVLLVALYAVPVISLQFENEFFRGAVLTLLVVAFLRLERVPAPEAPAAGAIAAAAAVLALLVAPALDRLDPWWDYETWALSAGGSKSTTFQWEGDYGPLDWPRDGREMLRIRARQGTYWKADQLDHFDGERWQRSQLSSQVAAGSLVEEIDPGRLERWTQRIRVTVRNLRSDTFVVAGIPRDIDAPRRALVPTGRPGVIASSRTLKRGDSYEASVYTPRPSRRELREAGTAYLDRGLRSYTSVEASAGTGLAGGSPTTRFVYVPGFRERPVTPDANEFDGLADGAPLLRSGPMRRSWGLARRLARASDTPYAFAKRVESYLRDGFEYSETPGPAAQTIDGFLFDARRGYCQQFAGAMALLLRLGGVPARVAAGFSAGSYDERTKEYVVRDFDGHEWVEVWFPRIGWVPFDPTPASAPPRAQAFAEDAPSAAIGDRRDLGTDIGLGSAPLRDDSPTPWALIAAAAASALAAAFALRAHLRRRGAAGRLSPAVHELERALRITRPNIDPSTTLAALEHRFAAMPAAAGYLRALSAERYGPRGSGPTREQRAALRRALAGGRDPRSWLRAWWALPPRLH